MALVCWTSVLWNIRAETGKADQSASSANQNGLSVEENRLLKQRRNGSNPGNGAVTSTPRKGHGKQEPRKGGGGDEIQRLSSRPQQRHPQKKSDKGGRNRRPRRRRRRRRRRRQRPQVPPEHYDPHYPGPTYPPPMTIPPFIPPPQEFRCAPVIVSGIPLSSYEEIPMGSVNSFGTGLAEVILCGEMVCISMEYSDLTGPITGLHLHQAPFGFNGPVVVDFFSVPVEGNFAEGCVVVDHDLVSEMQSNVGKFYVNVHTNAFPGGELRGQLDSGIIDMDIPPNNGNYDDPMYDDPMYEEPLYGGPGADLSCFAFGESNLVPGSNLPAGRGSFWSSACGNEFLFTMEVFGMSGPLDQIYLVDMMNSGNIIVDLIDSVTDVASIDSGTGFLINISVELPDDLTTAIFDDPRGFGVSISSSANPGQGDIRGPIGTGGTTGALLPPAMVTCQSYERIPLARTDASDGGSADLSVCAYDVDKAEICLSAVTTTSTPVVGALLADNSVGELLLLFEDITVSFVDNQHAVYACSPVDDELDAMVVQTIMETPDLVLIVLQTEMVPDGEVGGILVSGEFVVGGEGGDIPMPPPIFEGEPITPGQGGGDMIVLPEPVPARGPR